MSTQAGGPFSISSPSFSEKQRCSCRRSSGGRPSERAPCSSDRVRVRVRVSVRVRVRVRVRLGLALGLVPGLVLVLGLGQGLERLQHAPPCVRLEAKERGVGEVARGGGGDE